MDCPFCASPMEKGFLQAGSMVVWTKKKHYLSLIPREGEVALTWQYPAVIAIPAWICKRCEKVIVDYSDT